MAARRSVQAHSDICWAATAVGTQTRDYVTLRSMLRNGGEGVDWIRVPQDRGKWLALVNTAMNLRVQYTAGTS
jgi:hypothetical protein